MKFQRRDFLGLLGLGGVAAALPTCLQASAPAPAEMAPTGEGDGLCRVNITSKGEPVAQVVIGEGKISYKEPEPKPSSIKVCFTWDEGTCVLSLINGNITWSEDAQPVCMERGVLQMLPTGHITFTLQGMIESSIISGSATHTLLSTLMEKEFTMCVPHKGRNLMMVFKRCRLQRLETDMRYISMEGVCFETA